MHKLLQDILVHGQGGEKKKREERKNMIIVFFSSYSIFNMKATK